MTASFEKTTEKTVAQSAAKHAASQGGLLPCLHEIQAELGCIPNERGKYRHRVALDGGSSWRRRFYHDFRTSPSAPLVSRFAVPKPVRHPGRANWRLALPMFWVLSLMQRIQRITTASSECTVWVIVPAVPRFA